jgi:hypothetical protein
VFGWLAMKLPFHNNPMPTCLVAIDKHVCQRNVPTCASPSPSPVISVSPAARPSTPSHAPTLLLLLPGCVPHARNCCIWRGKTLHFLSTLPIFYSHLNI